MDEINVNILSRNMKYVRALLILVWIISTAVLVASLPTSIRFACRDNCLLAVQVDRIVGGRPERVGPELRFLEVNEGKSLFTESEISHLIDVNLISAQSSLKFGVVLAGIVAVFAMMSWEAFFIGFHKLFFPQGNWAFPPDSNLLMIYPEYFWQRMSGLVTGTVLVIYGALMIAVRHHTKRSRFKTT
ncbi:MAG: hypothetical protein UW26_C0024G0010 [Candidatus Collierbacteria bacterium GW2011_GWF1_44_12]|uniref:DUF1461 domain-containing protein n=1 Tax=Candidatus Collierbacteria bacterium GW2011_GWF1_44_12 TaxID=1618402 RepID=A0A0G1J166_9BACT|nr:MAG: hypothetical protein UW26_C0024G0010 [Candidatus Collierbacteria bacterium GW2011_GWF1_44_12]